MAIVFEHLDYRDFLNDWLRAQPGGGRGLKKKIAEFLRCQGAFISQVLHKDSHFTLEHGHSLNTFLQHSAEESDYFLLLIQYQRAGNEGLRSYFRAKLEKLQNDRLVLRNRIKDKHSLSDVDKQRYYSAWYYGAIRLLVLIPEFQTKEALVRRLRLSSATVSNALEFLTSTGMIQWKDDRYLPGEIHLHLGNDSPLIAKHHTNWRLRALASLEEERPNDLHYSLGMTLSKEDIVKIKGLIVDYIEGLQKIIRPSSSETLCSLCIDFFEL